MVLINTNYALLNALKAVIASFIGYLIGHFLGDYLNVTQMYSWIVVTILVIMSSQPNLGGAIDKAVMRFFATAFTAVIAIAIIYFFSEQAWTVLAFSLCLIFIGVFIANSIPKYTYAGVLGSVTVAITMFGQNISVSFAFYRALEVLIGIFIALLINRFVFPIRAEKQIEKSFSETIREIKNLHDYLIEGKSYETLLSKLFSHFSKQITLLKEIKYEKAKIHMDHYSQINRTIRRLYRHICILHEYIDTYPEKRQKFSHHNHFLALFDVIKQLLKQLEVSFLHKKVMPTDELDKAQEKLKAFMETLNIEPEYRHSSTLVFSLQSIINMIEAITQAQKSIYQS
ncbi:FUSC family protein [Thiotrichales bacterium 19S3-7]|nr:FUSC family protein [Thiotrichales bacterium 19S3-7]MCF6802442.1 FUSC family protein [Thiotrichales bacterium 19S3-11]